MHLTGNEQVYPARMNKALGMWCQKVFRAMTTQLS